jgi:hypothetical protein
MLKNDLSVPEFNELLPELSNKFVSNLTECLKLNPINLSNIEAKGRAIALLGSVLRTSGYSARHHTELLVTFDEIFADTVLSILFAGWGLDIPARIILRRALELGIAVLYLWDLPVQFAGWKDHDKDLNFREMTEHLSTDSYKTFISSENPAYKGEQVLNLTCINHLYRRLSNTSHGKWSTFEALSRHPYSFDSADWSGHLRTIAEVEDLLLGLWRLRFPHEYGKLTHELPTITQETMI